MEHWGGGDPVLLRQEGTEVPLEGNIWSFRQDTRLPIHISRTLDSVWSNWTEAVLIMLRDGTQPRAEKPKPTAELRGKRVRGTAMANEQRCPQAQDNKYWSAHTAWDSRSPWPERPLTQKAFQRSYTQEASLTPTNSAACQNKVQQCTKWMSATIRRSAECCNSRCIGKCPTRAARSKLLWTLTFRVWWQ